MSWRWFCLGRLYRYRCWSSYHPICADTGSHVIDNFLQRTQFSEFFWTELWQVRELVAHRAEIVLCDLDGDWEGRYVRPRTELAWDIYVLPGSHLEAEGRRAARDDRRSPHRRRVAADGIGAPDLAWMAWVFGGIGCMTVAVLRSIFPSTAAAYHIPENQQGTVFFVFCAVQALTGLALSRVPRLQPRSSRRTARPRHE